MFNTKTVSSSQYGVVKLEADELGVTRQDTGHLTRDLKGGAAWVAWSEFEEKCPRVSALISQQPDNVLVVSTELARREDSTRDNLDPNSAVNVDVKNNYPHMTWQNAHIFGDCFGVPSRLPNEDGDLMPQTAYQPRSVNLSTDKRIEKKIGKTLGQGDGADTLRGSGVAFASFSKDGTGLDVLRFVHADDKYKFFAYSIEGDESKAVDNENSILDPLAMNKKELKAFNKEKETAEIIENLKQRQRIEQQALKLVSPDENSRPRRGTTKDEQLNLNVLVCAKNLCEETSSDRTKQISLACNKKVDGILGEMRDVAKFSDSSYTAERFFVEKGFDDFSYGALSMVRNGFNREKARLERSLGKEWVGEFESLLSCEIKSAKEIEKKVGKYERENKVNDKRTNYNLNGGESKQRKAGGAQ
jgi:hypothetical protein